MSYRDGAGYGHGGYHSDLPPTHLGDIPIDPDEFPAVAQHLQHLNIGSGSTGSSRSTGYPEDGARHLYVQPDGSHHYTNDVPGTIATYTGYNYIPAPEGATPAHPFAGALRSPVDASFHAIETIHHSIPRNTDYRRLHTPVSTARKFYSDSSVRTNSLPATHTSILTTSLARHIIIHRKFRETQIRATIPSQ
ncbi:hypothetical protein ABW20_dc0109719 [Dactylellina cionopaga]|nr:hypothetical protein ABW20_dc0109719 [Dactylellina cionopaga]